MGPSVRYPTALPSTSRSPLTAAFHGPVQPRGRGKRYDRARQGARLFPLARGARSMDRSCATMSLQEASRRRLSRGCPMVRDPATPGATIGLRNLAARSSRYTRVIAHRTIPSGCVVCDGRARADPAPKARRSEPIPNRHHAPSNDVFGCQSRSDRPVRSTAYTFASSIVA